MVFLLSPEARGRRYADLVELAATWDGAPQQLVPMSLAAWLQSGFGKPSNWRDTPSPLRRAFPDGGYYVLGEKRATPEEVLAVFDAAPLGYLSIAAHGHADCLSFTLSLGGEPLLIDPGTYCYHTEPEWRNYFRGTSAHNTVRVDQQDQSEIGGPFMWVRKAQPTVEVAELQEIRRQRVRASHDGYAKLAHPVKHTREVVFEPGTSSLSVQDEIQTTGPHVIERFWHCAEHCEVRQLDSRSALILGRRARLTLNCAEDGELHILRGSQSPRSGWVSHRFGSMQPTTTVIVTNRVHSAAVLGTTLQWAFTR